MGTRVHLNEKGAWRFLNVLLLTCIGLSGTGKLPGIAELRPVHFLTAFAALILLFFLNYASVRGRVLGILSGIIAFLGAGAFMGIHNYADFVKSYFSWQTGALLWQEEWVTGYEALQVIFLVCVCYLLQILAEKIYQIKITIVIILLAGLLFCLFSERKLTHGEVAFVLCYIGTIFAEWTEGKWEKEKRKSIHSYMLWIMPFLGLYLMLMLLMPVPEAPYGWQFVRNIYAHLKESFLEISQNLSGGGREDYDLSLSGFTEDGELAGALGRRDREIMTIESSAPLATNVYLTGKVYDTFDGRRWLQSREDTEKERYADTARTLCALAKYEEDYQQDYLLRARIKISYRYFHTSFLFAPLKLWELQQKGDKMPFREQDGSFLLDKPGGYGTEYEAVFYQMNGGQEAFYHFLQEGRQTSDEKLPEKILKDLRGVTGQEIRAEDLAYQRQRVYDTCLKETALSENVRDALLEMTQGAETDVERLRAIEASLASLNYTRSPGELPDVISNESEFLDYFLLESRQGYCNYFATAFVLLARAQGIPARYVQGFCVPMRGKKEAVVYSYMAHAWPEAYLDGIGWIPFEPTPGFAGSRYTPWGLKSDKAEVYKESDFQNKWQSKAGQEDGMIPQETVAEDSVSSRGNSGARRFFGIAGLSFLAVFLMGILVLASDYLLHRYRYQKMNNEQKLNEDIRKIFKMLARTGIKRENGETLEEFAERCEDLLDTKGILCFIGNYEGYLYGNKEIIPENIEEVKKKQNEIMELLWKRNKLDYFKAKFL